jgi:biopolymer transport protein ExbD
MPRVTIAPEADLATQINVLPLIDVLLVLIIVFFLLNRDLIYIPAQVALPAAPGAVTDGGPIVLEVTQAGGYPIRGKAAGLGPRMT